MVPVVCADSVGAATHAVPGPRAGNRRGGALVTDKPKVCDTWCDTSCPHFQPGASPNEPPRCTLLERELGWYDGWVAECPPEDPL